MVDPRARSRSTATIAACAFRARRPGAAVRLARQAAPERSCRPRLRRRGEPRVARDSDRVGRRSRPGWGPPAAAPGARARPARSRPRPHLGGLRFSTRYAGGPRQSPGAAPCLARVGRGRRTGEELQVIWEIEPGTKILEQAELPPIAGDRLDDQGELEAFLDAVRWGAVTSADQRSLQAPFRSGITIEDYQLEPLVRALRMPRTTLLIADDVLPRNRRLRLRRRLPLRPALK
jgi:hypothetical protein